jgi:hypothetical protein
MFTLTVRSREKASVKLPFSADASAIRKFRDSNGVTSVYIYKAGFVILRWELWIVRVTAVKLTTRGMKNGVF